MPISILYFLNCFFHRFNFNCFILKLYLEIKLGSSDELDELNRPEIKLGQGDLFLLFTFYICVPGTESAASKVRQLSDRYWLDY